MTDETTSHPAVPPSAGEPARHSSVAGRVWSLRTVAAAAITAVALSGAAGAALAAASDGGTSAGPGGRGGFGPPGQMTGQMTGQLPGRNGGPPPMSGVPGRDT